MAYQNLAKFVKSSVTITRATDIATQFAPHVGANANTWTIKAVKRTANFLQSTGIINNTGCKRGRNNGTVGRMAM